MGKKRIIAQTEEELLKERGREALQSPNELGKVEAKIKGEAEQAAKKVKKARVCISSSYNNTIISLTDVQGNVLAWMSAGSVGFKGAKKATPFAASKVAEAISQTIKKIGITKVVILVKGIGSGRESAIRSLVARGIDIISIKDITPIPHNGCRPVKARRV
ncbi:MAG: 30S ribosomal protein S11 [Candidatus Nealsonbacteria bacterium]|nr:30S ribosomal protein S11 [Candidatus Nealsonbacteria bacterium]